MFGRGNTPHVLYYKRNQNGKVNNCLSDIQRDLHVTSLAMLQYQFSAARKTAFPTSAREIRLRSSSGGDYTVRFYVEFHTRPTGTRFSFHR
ncbi:hypothetical protein FKM82_003622 [Ascaphus truei]